MIYYCPLVRFKTDVADVGSGHCSCCHSFTDIDQSLSCLGLLSTTSTSTMLLLALIVQTAVKVASGLGQIQYDTVLCTCAVVVTSKEVIQNNLCIVDCDQCEQAMGFRTNHRCYCYQCQQVTVTVSVSVSAHSNTALCTDFVTGSTSIKRLSHSHSQYQYQLSFTSRLQSEYSFIITLCTLHCNCKCNITFYNINFLSVSRLIIHFIQNKSQVLILQIHHVVTYSYTQSRYITGVLSIVKL